MRRPPLPRSWLMGEHNRRSRFEIGGIFFITDEKIPCAAGGADCSRRGAGSTSSIQRSRRPSRSARVNKVKGCAPREYRHYTNEAFRGRSASQDAPVGTPPDVHACCASLSRLVTTMAVDPRLKPEVVCCWSGKPAPMTQCTVSLKFRKALHRESHLE